MNDPRSSAPIFVTGVPRWGTTLLAAMLEAHPWLQESAFAGHPRLPLDDAALEADEMYQNARKKGIPHPDPSDPPRQQAARARQPGP